MSDVRKPQFLHMATIPWLIVWNNAFLSEFESRSIHERVVDTLNWYIKTDTWKEARKPVLTTGNDWAEDLSMLFSLSFLLPSHLPPLQLSSSIHCPCCQWQDPQAHRCGCFYLKRHTAGIWKCISWGPSRVVHESSYLFHKYFRPPWL